MSVKHRRQGVTLRLAIIVRDSGSLGLDGDVGSRGGGWVGVGVVGSGSGEEQVDRVGVFHALVKSVCVAPKGGQDLPRIGDASAEAKIAVEEDRFVLEWRNRITH